MTKSSSLQVSAGVGSQSDKIHQRLPPNRRRHKVSPSNRQRVVCACNPCNVRRIKCTGERPCKACARNSRECIYPEVTERVYVRRDELEALKRECAVLKRCLEEVVPSEAQREALIQKWSEAVSKLPAEKEKSANGEYEERECHDLPKGRILRYSDSYARFHGASAGGLFIDQLRGLVAMVLPALGSSQSSQESQPEKSFASFLGRIHTYDSRPIELNEIDPFELPPFEEIAGLLGAFWGYTEDRNDPFGCGGIYYWGNLREILPHAAAASRGAQTKGLCLLNATLALACQFESFPAQRGEHNPGETFFTRAKQLLGNPLAESTLTDMHALTFMSYYLLGSGRRDTAYIYICAAMRIAMTHGLHDGWVANERQKREFWNMFILDRWLSCLTGRPSSISNESLILDLPERPIGQDANDLPPPDGLRAHVQLALIMGDISSKIYGACSRKQPLATFVCHINDCLQNLSEWLNSLPSTVQLTMSPSAENPNKIILHLIYNQLVLLCTRPLLFLAVKARLTYYFVDATHSQRLQFPDSLIGTCVDAARRNAGLISGLMESRLAAMMLTLRYHYSFNAATVLALALLLPQHARTDDARLIETLLQDLKNPGQTENECSLDCAKMIAELYSIVERLRRLTFMSSRSPDTGGSQNSGDSRYDGDDLVRITCSRVLSAVELSTSYLPEITVSPEDPNRSSAWQATQANTGHSVLTSDKKTNNPI
ncbi:hypothetical protein VTN77DRAFT_2005 [Rasamsonia byssochlamydoides]|uniref:uncharacterized protein n=1 Tax=Rasamsonia byssochlamydoides TaxID=89139 RepID=UPI00374232F5